MTDRYSADRAPVPDGPYMVTATHRAILAQLRRCSWSVGMESDYLHTQYGTRRLGTLSEAQARGFLAYLTAQPTANPQWQQEVHP